MKWNTEAFVTGARDRHGDRYDYSQVNYVNSSTRVIIICQIHGGFSQLPYNHLIGRGCPRCAHNQPLTVEEKIDTLSQIHDGRYEYDRTTLTDNNKRPIRVICEQHGPFLVSYYKHRTRAGCPDCTGHYQHKAKYHFERRAKAVHGDKYTYGEYKGAATKMEIICPVHGPFYQTPASHRQGHGCPRCANDRKKLLAKGGYSEAFFVLHPEMTNTPATFYVIEFTRAGEAFLKVGITRTTVKFRFKSGYRKYGLRVIVAKKSALYSAFQLEQVLLKEFQGFQTFPKQDCFVGKTECLSVSCLPALLAWLDSRKDISPALKPTFATAVFDIQGCAMILRHFQAGSDQLSAYF